MNEKSVNKHPKKVSTRERFRSRLSLALARKRAVLKGKTWKHNLALQYRPKEAVEKIALKI